MFFVFLSIIIFILNSDNIIKYKLTERILKNKKGTFEKKSSFFNGKKILLRVAKIAL